MFRFKMLRCVLLGCVLLGCVLAIVSGQNQCEPGVNCDLPNCRCWFDLELPGGLTPAEVPQMVLVSFEDAVNIVNVPLYRSLFQEPNPNGCPASGTYFIKDEDTDYSMVLDLFEEGNEIGAGSVDGSYPESAAQWTADLKMIKDKLAEVGITTENVKGVRAPELRGGGTEEFIGIGNNQYEYDASCTTTEFDDKGNTKWPYTYDFIPGPGCDNGEPPSAPFEGKWQFLLPALIFNGTKCATPTACTGLRTQTDVFDMFENNFALHYEGNRAPFILVITADFVLVPFKLAGLQEFLQYVRAAFPDTWVVPMYKALQWVQSPVANDNITNFQPWAC